MPSAWESPILRRQKLAAIHVAKAQLGLDDDTYRQLLERVSAARGKACRSAADLTADQAFHVLDELRRLGAVRPTTVGPKGRAKPAHYPGTPHNMNWLPGEITKIEALLADLGLTWAYADAIAARMFRIERVAWCKKREQLVAIIAALHVEQEKRDLLGSITDYCNKAQTTLDEIAARFKLANGWQRRRATLKSVRAQLANDALAKELGLEA
jgi:phage gp16-like protein